MTTFAAPAVTDHPLELLDRFGPEPDERTASAVHGASPKRFRKPEVGLLPVPAGLAAGTVFAASMLLILGAMVTPVAFAAAALTGTPLIAWLALRRLARSVEDAGGRAVFASRALWDAPAEGVEMSVVVPFFNPGRSLRPTIERLVEVLTVAEVGFEVIAVSDGSTDGSETSIRNISSDVRVIVAARNSGKGAALHLGFSAARGRYVGFVDADGDIDPVHLLDYLQRMRGGRSRRRVRVQTTQQERVGCQHSTQDSLADVFDPRAAALSTLGD